MFLLHQSRSLNVKGVFRATAAVVRSLPLYLARVPAGFPSPADSYLEESSPKRHRNRFHYRCRACSK